MYGEAIAKWHDRRHVRAWERKQRSTAAVALNCPQTTGRRRRVAPAAPASIRTIRGGELGTRTSQTTGTHHGLLAGARGSAKPNRGWLTDAAELLAEPRPGPTLG